MAHFHNQLRPVEFKKAEFKDPDPPIHPPLDPRMTMNFLTRNIKLVCDYLHVHVFYFIVGRSVVGSKKSTTFVRLCAVNS